jgi:hypothetical protein
MSRRRFALLLLTAVAMAASAAGASAAQATTTGSINVQYTPGGVSPTSSVGSVSVSINATSKLTSMTVSVHTLGIAYCDGTDVLDLPMSDFVQPAHDGDGQWGTWTLSTPITTSQLSLGSYEVCVTAADQGGDTVSADVGPLYYFNIVQFPTFTSSGTSFSYDNQDVTLSGAAQMLAPDGTTTPFAGKTLTVADFGTNPTTVTGADGSFSVQFPVLATGPYWVYYANDGSTTGSSPPVNLTLTTFPVHIAAALTAKHVNQGQPVSVSGTVTYDDKGVKKPLAGNTVWLCGSGDPYPCASTWSSYAAGSATTNASGKFTMRVPSAASDLWKLQTTQTTYFPATSVSLPLSVALANAITGFNARLDSFGRITYSGCVIAPVSGIAIEYAAKPSGPWRRLRAKTAIGSTACTRGQRFSGTTIAQLAAAYYRAIFAATPQWQSATSKTVYLWKYLTKITNFSVRPHHVAHGGHIRVSGRLWTDNGRGQWLPYGHRHVIVVFRYRGQWYRYRGEPRTNRAGWFSGRFPVYASSPFFAQFNGNKTHFASASVVRRVTAGALRLTGRPWLRLRVPLADLVAGQVRLARS